MDDAKAILDHQYLPMRERALSLAADLDRIQRAPNGPAVLSDDPRLGKLRRVFQLLLSEATDRAEEAQHILSDQTPPPEH